MKLSMRSRRVVTTVARAVLGLALLVGIGGSLPTPVVADHAWHGYHWESSGGPITVKLGDNVSGDWDNLLQSVGTDWTADRGARDVVDAQVVAGKTKPNPCPATLGRVEVCNAAYGENGWLGLATVWTDGKHVVKGTVKLNDSFHEQLPYSTPTAKQHVLCMEVGHTLGLDHIASGTCMNDDPLLATQLYTAPDAHDNEQLAKIYAHKHREITRDKRKHHSGHKHRSRTDSGAGDHSNHNHTHRPRIGGQTDPFSAAESVPPDPVRAELGEVTVLVEDLGGGRQRITHILWLPV